MLDIFFKKGDRKHQGYSTSLVLVFVLTLAGVVAVAFGLMSQQAMSKPSSVKSNELPPTAQSSKTTKELPRSVPVSIGIPAIAVNSELMKLGKNADSTIEIPKDVNYHKAGWYKYSATPGEKGATVILGHVDSAESGPSIFFRLGKLKKSDMIHIKRTDNKTVTYKVDGIREYSKDAFPTSEVYDMFGPPSLRLVTCGGDFNQSTGQYESNLVVFASLHEPAQETKVNLPNFMSPQQL